MDFKTYYNHTYYSEKIPKEYIYEYLIELSTYEKYKDEHMRCTTSGFNGEDITSIKFTTSQLMKSASDRINELENEINKLQYIQKIIDKANE